LRARGSPDRSSPLRAELCGVLPEDQPARALVAPGDLGRRVRPWARRLRAPLPRPEWRADLRAGGAVRVQADVAVAAARRAPGACWTRARWVASSGTGSWSRSWWVRSAMPQVTMSCQSRRLLR